AVATIGEGRQLRKAGVAAPVLVLGPPADAELAEALALDLALTVGDLPTIEALAAASRQTGRPARAHLKIDTGMARLGLLPHAALPVLNTPAARELSWQGIFTHLACADEPWRAETAVQLARFEAVLVHLQAYGFSFPLVHAANTAGALAFPQARYSAVRAGIALYGVAPSAHVSLPAGFKPALAFHSCVLRVADLPAGTPVSYGGTYITPGPRRIATIAVGYADGMRRSPPWRAVLIGGRRTPVVGRICMDYSMVDITEIEDVAVGDEVVLLGSQGDHTISAAVVAGWLDTSVYEVLTAILPGQPRLPANEFVPRLVPTDRPAAA
ncbi:MAG: alanine racemase, partial [Roseiflexaceae bacterium]|nr:alanine racemase [Roseiflexaceae bacterium]